MTCAQDTTTFNSKLRTLTNIEFVNHGSDMSSCNATEVLNFLSYSSVVSTVESPVDLEQAHSASQKRIPPLPSVAPALRASRVGAGIIVRVQIFWITM